MWILQAPESKFGVLPWGKHVITPSVKFFNNICFTEKFLYAKDHMLAGCVDITPRYLRKHRTQKKIDNFLVISKGGIGDILWLFPFLKNLRDKYPKSNIAVLTDERGLKVYQNFPHITCVIKDEGWLTQAVYDAADEVYDFGGMATIYKHLYGLDPVERPFKMVGLPWPKERKEMRPHIVLTAVEGKAIINFLADHGVTTYKDKIVTICIDSSTPNRDWPIYHNLSLARELARAGNKVILLSTKAHMKDVSFVNCDCGYISTFTPPDGVNSYDFTCPKCHKPVNAFTDLKESGIINLSGKTDIRQYFCIVAVSDLLIAPNSSGVVVGTSLNTPTIGIFGNFDPKGRVKYYERFHAIKGHCPEKDCGEHWTECRLGHPAPCMRSISVKEVLAIANEMLVKYAKPAENKIPMA